jgi:N,N'-diacetylchitobiose transport system permease protein
MTAHPSRRGTRLADLTGVLVCVVLGFPVLWMLSTAFKSGPEIFSYTPHLIPQHPTLANFESALSREGFWTNVRNSVVIVSSTVVISLGLAMLAAIGLARFEFRGRGPFVALLLAVQMVPLTAMIIPIFLLLDRAGLTDRLSGVVLTYLTFVLPFAVWTLRGFVLNIPPDLEEAAMVDGCTRLQAWRRILLPLVAPGLVATSIFAFIQAWNEYVMAYVLLQSPEHQTLTVWLASFTSSRGTQWGPLMAAATLTALPVVIFFVIVQRRIVTGLTSGAVKG